VLAEPVAERALLEVEYRTFSKKAPSPDGSATLRRAMPFK
jgi:hypothetical protein